jgi:hypothetical protein
LLEGFPEGFFDLDFQGRQAILSTTSTAMLSHTETSSGGVLRKRSESLKKTDCKEQKKDGQNTSVGKGTKEEKKGGDEGGSRVSGEGGSSSSRSSSTTAPAAASAAALPSLKKEKARLERELRKLEREKKETSP